MSKRNSYIAVPLPQWHQKAWQRGALCIGEIAKSAAKTSAKRYQWRKYRRQRRNNGEKQQAMARMASLILREHGSSISMASAHL